jgi:hypothetical protein
MTKIIALLGAAYIGGVLRHPHEGAIPVSDADAKRLVEEEKLAEDVTDGFSEEQIAEMPDAAVSVSTGPIAAPDVENPHLAEVAPAPAPETKPARKGADSKE